MFVQALEKIVGSGNWWPIPGENPAGIHPAILVTPENTRAISSLLKLCNAAGMPVTPQGGGTGVTGGAYPFKGGVVLSLKRLDQIISIEKQNRFAVVEAGVITETFCEAVESAGMYFPIQPGSKGSSFIGGNLALNAGSPKSCKYGTFKDYVLNLEVVLPTGEIIWTGANVHKNATGLNLTQLFVGSEGTLGIITKAVLKILPKPSHSRVFVAGFSTLETACQACLVLAEMSGKPSGIELITEEAIVETAVFIPKHYPMLQPPVTTHVLVEAECNSQMEMDLFVEEVFAKLSELKPHDTVMGATSQEKDFLWLLRKSIEMAMTSNGRNYRDIDACVPPDALYCYLTAARSLAREHHRTLISFGHAMDGNLHTMLLTEAGEKHDPESERAFLTKMYGVAVSLRGAISGEHGIGMLQQEFLPIQLSAKHLSLAKALKSVFDPAHILNPGKLLMDV